MKMKNKRLALIPILLAMTASGQAWAEDSQLLMYAGKLNIEHRIAAECNEAVPGFLAGYEAQFNILNAKVFQPKGITPELRSKAEAVPELASEQYLEKFKSSSPEQQLKRCIQLLLEIESDVFSFGSN